MNKTQNILLIISGSIAAYKTLELIRLFKKDGMNVTCILSKGGEKFVTPMTVGALSENHVYTDLWSLKDEQDMGHIQLTREADIIVVAPSSANLIAKAANGIADDLATATLLAADKPAYFVPAMNVKMWENKATQRNVKTLKDDGHFIIEPQTGDMACGEFGAGRMADPNNIFDAIKNAITKNNDAQTQNADIHCDITKDNAYLNNKNRPLSGKHIFITAGPTHEPIDPVRFIGNRSSGKQGYALASSLVQQGAKVTLISGPTSLQAPDGVKIINVQTAKEMLQACENALPADIAVFCAAVGDWYPVNPMGKKLKKTDDGKPPEITLKENPDILKTIANHKHRPSLVIGFAAETDDVVENAKKKLNKKNCDWILANPVNQDQGQSVFGSDQNHVYFISKNNTEDWTQQSKHDIAIKLTEKIIENIDRTHDQNVLDAAE